MYQNLKSVNVTLMSGGESKNYIVNKDKMEICSDDKNVLLSSDDFNCFLDKFFRIIRRCKNNCKLPYQKKYASVEVVEMKGTFKYLVMDDCALDIHRMFVNIIDN
jgi:hypothetical protein